MQFTFFTIIPLTTKMVHITLTFENFWHFQIFIYIYIYLYIHTHQHTLPFIYIHINTHYSTESSRSFPLSTLKSSKVSTLPRTLKTSKVSTLPRLPYKMGIKLTLENFYLHRTAATRITWGRTKILETSAHCQSWPCYTDFREFLPESSRSYPHHVDTRRNSQNVSTLPKLTMLCWLLRISARVEPQLPALHGHAQQLAFRWHTATHCNTLQHTATHCNTLQHTATHCSTLQHTATHCNTLQHVATYCNMLQHAVATWLLHICNMTPPHVCVCAGSALSFIWANALLQWYNYFSNVFICHIYI